MSKKYIIGDALTFLKIASFSEKTDDVIFNKRNPLTFFFMIGFALQLALKESYVIFRDSFNEVYK